MLLAIQWPCLGCQCREHYLQRTFHTTPETNRVCARGKLPVSIVKQTMDEGRGRGSAITEALMYFPQGMAQ
jgi:hypothetical protein